jgi:hypothetical protein
MTSNHIDKLKKNFFYKNISVGQHNVTYKQADILKSIIQASNSKETIGEHCREPDSDTIYRRLKLNINELIYQFQETTKQILTFMWKRFPRERWEILVDTRDKLFYGKKGDEYVIGTKEGKKCFRFLAVTAVCRKCRVTCAIMPIKKGSKKVKILKPILEWILKIIRPFNFLADAGFGSGKFIKMIQKLRLSFVIRVRAIGDIKRYIEQGKTIEVHHYELKDKSRVYFHAKFGKDKNGNCWALATSHYRTHSNHLWEWYSRRWEIENSFKTQDRVELKTASRYCKMRLFCQMITALLYVIWNIWRIICRVYYTIKQFVRLVVCKLLFSTYLERKRLEKNYSLDW